VQYFPFAHQVIAALQLEKGGIAVATFARVFCHPLMAFTVCYQLCLKPVSKLCGFWVVACMQNKSVVHFYLCLHVLAHVNVQMCSWSCRIMHAHEK